MKMSTTNVSQGPCGSFCGYSGSVAEAAGASDTRRRLVSAHRSYQIKRQARGPDADNC